MTTDPQLLESIRTNTDLNAMRAKIARFGKVLFDRRLTDIAGGNISARVGEYICISPRYSGSARQWQLTPEDVLVSDQEMNVLDGNGVISREAKVHFRLHREFGEHGTGVVHAHARNILVFAAMNMAMPPVLEATQKFGTVPVVPYAPAHGNGLAESVAGGIRGNESRIRKQAAGVIAAWHGLFVIGKDLDAALDAVERMDNNAYCILMGKLLQDNDMMESQRAALAQAQANYKE
ncbi:MAG: class II aldolase/adducin family protein [Chloroflexi bacterium]|nr:class II aldolase/adducin family protein [Chloroflexota bacterium]MCC6894267.1 class II aldolase/adducin family protein [Anaerolineae bacterium]